MDDDFAIKFWHYLYEQRAFLSKSFLSLVRNSAVTPVLGDIPGEIQYVRFDEKNIYTDPTAEISPAQYYVLSEKIISRRDIEEIFKVFQISVNQMDERYRESLFCEIWRNIYNSILHLHYTLICSKSIDRTTTSKSGARKYFVKIKTKASFHLKTNSVKSVSGKFIYAMKQKTTLQAA